MIKVEVIYALPLEQTVVALELEEGATVFDAIERSALRDGLAQSYWGTLKVGVWGRLVNPDFLLRDGDRVEIYRPLLADPKDVRRRRARPRTRT